MKMEYPRVLIEMSQFKGYKVHLALKNGKQLDGEIISATETYIELKTDTATMKLSGSDIEDLEVLELAPKKSSNRQKKSNGKKKEDTKTPEPKSKPVMEEFDFAANLKKFDKESVFADLEREELAQHGGVPPKRDNGKIGIHEQIVVDQEVAKPTPSNATTTNTTMTTSTSEHRSNSQIQSAKSGQFIVQSTKKAVPTFTTLKLSQILDYAREKVGLPSSTLYETAATNLSCLISFRLVDSKVETPLVVHFVGNNSNGAISITTARHLLNLGFNVIIYYHNSCAENNEDDDDDDIKEDITRELGYFRALDGVVVEDMVSLNKELKSSNKNINLLVDSLQDEYTDLTSISGEDHRKLESIIGFINSCPAMTVSLAVPTGINMSSGVLDLDSGAVDADIIVSIGVVMTSLVNMYKFSAKRSQHWILNADYPRMLRAKGNLRKYDNVSFRSTNICKLEFVEN